MLQKKELNHTLFARTLIRALHTFKVVKKFAEGVPWSKVIQKVANAERGTRIFPSQTPKNDEKYNLRFDKGSVVGGKHELILQANKNAENAGVKAAAAADSHKIWAKILVDPENVDEKKAEADLIESFKETD
ncbi:uncharacterized protein CIMG_12020 [Coccidioides immitis RS]|uniref:Uncharacterized protein n=1 Tax=Coccidioides immitis (strain RS) TaxID=246410 RepID=A0A0D8JUS2_COCIM|nr:uncharacterized protein CIMG_12020 [Coccidioides immitis RS]KJF60889.1 hypothetical protein CIMG_12020 [Coccidioides immitis RS]TPX22805.1 hypothetical protein DIZ76_014684 [Coccidioides immitis]